MDKSIYVFELKLKAKPEIALEQIKERRYYERFLHQGKKVILIGLSFITENNKINLGCIQEFL